MSFSFFLFSFSLFLTLLRRQVDHQHGDGVAALHQHRVVSLHDGVRQARILHPAPVDEQRDLSPVGTIQLRRRHQPPHRDRREVVAVVIDAETMRVLTRSP